MQTQKKNTLFPVCDDNLPENCFSLSVEKLKKKSHFNTNPFESKKSFYYHTFHGYPFKILNYFRTRHRAISYGFRQVLIFSVTLVSTKKNEKLKEKEQKRKFLNLFSALTMIRHRPLKYIWLPKLWRRN
jgi:hypothetical protein